MIVPITAWGRRHAGPNAPKDADLSPRLQALAYDADTSRVLLVDNHLLTWVRADDIDWEDAEQ